MDTTTSTIHDVPRPAGSHPSTVEVPLALDSPQSRIAIRIPGGVLGRADAVWESRADSHLHIWAAKHHWTEGPRGQESTVFEFDEALPAGAVILRILFTPEG